MGFSPFFLSKNWRSFVPRNFRVIVNSDDQLVAQSFCLSQCICLNKK